MDRKEIYDHSYYLENASLIRLTSADTLKALAEEKLLRSKEILDLEKEIKCLSGKKADLEKQVKPKPVWKRTKKRNVKLKAEIFDLILKERLADKRLHLANERLGRVEVFISNLEDHLKTRLNDIIQEDIEAFNERSLLKNLWFSALSSVFSSGNVSKEDLTTAASLGISCWELKQKTKNFALARTSFEEQEKWLNERVDECQGSIKKVMEIRGMIPV